MPRFFFHVREESFVRDPDGIELPDAAAARAAALEGIRGMICDQVGRGRLALGYGMEVEDEAGELVCALRFSDTVRIEP